MSVFAGGVFPGELDDAELGTILATVHRDLLGHAHRTADHIGALTAIMAHHDENPPPVEIPAQPPATTMAHERLSAVIVIRRRAAELHDELARVIARARDLAVDLDRALHDGRDTDTAVKAARAIAHSHDRQLSQCLRRARDLAVAITHDLARVRGLDRDLARDRDRVIMRQLSIDLTQDETFQGIRELDRVLSHSREVTIDREISGARELSVDLDRARRLSQAREDDRYLDPSRARQLAIAIDVALVRGRELSHDVMRRLNALEVDVSGADLTHLRLSDPEILTGVIWTKETAWPPTLADRIRTLSRERSPGVYQVRGSGPHQTEELLSV